LLAHVSTTSSRQAHLKPLPHAGDNLLPASVRENLALILVQVYANIVHELGLFGVQR
jgi:hypothetical protein